MNLIINNLTKNFSQKNILKNCSLEVKPGTITAIIGRNGSGKTTLFKSIIGETSINSGEILIDGKNILKHVKQKEHMIFIPDKYGYFKNTSLIKLANIYKLIYRNFDETYFYNELEKNNISKEAKFRTLSKGQSKLANIILALATNCKIILLDEPLDGIDILNSHIIVDYILDTQEKGSTIIIASHQLESLEKLCDTVYFIINKELLKIEFTNYYKYNVAYSKELSPNFFDDENIKIFNRVGNIYTIATKESKQFEEKLLAANPLKIEKVSINLTELFILLAK